MPVYCGPCGVAAAEEHCTESTDQEIRAAAERQDCLDGWSSYAKVRLKGKADSRFDSKSWHDDGKRGYDARW